MGGCASRPNLPPTDNHTKQFVTAADTRVQQRSHTLQASVMPSLHSLQAK